MSLQEEFATEIEAFLERHVMDPTTFGRLALGDPSFVFDVRGGRAPNLRTIERVRGFMAETRKAARTSA